MKNLYCWQNNETRKKYTWFSAKKKVNLRYLKDNRHNALYLYILDCFMFMSSSLKIIYYLLFQFTYLNIFDKS